MNDYKKFKDLALLIDLEFIKSVLVKLNELSKIVVEEKYSEESVVKKVEEINKKLYQLNSLPQGFYKEYNKEFAEWQNELKKKKEPFYQLLDEVRVVVDSTTDDRISISDKTQHLKQFMENYSIEESIEIMKKAFEFDIPKVVQLQSKRMFIRFSWERKIIQIFIKYIFKFRFLVIKIVSGLVSLIITTIMAKVLGFTLKDSSEWSISLLVFLISFFTIDIWIRKKVDKIFWKFVRKQTLILFNQLNIYTAHIVAIIQFLKKY